MKKLTAMLLALCMLLAAVPALGEDASGNWYMTLADVSLGYITLNTDGTAALGLPGQDEITGTWTQEEGKVTVTAEGQSLDFAFDGTSLTSEMFPLSITREEGKVSMDLMSKMMNSEEYELPEGMTETDMMMIAVNFMTEYAQLMETVGGMAGETGTGTAEPAEEVKVDVLKEGFRVNESYSGFRATYIAKIQNNTSAPLYVTDGSMVLKDAAGNVVGEAKYMSSRGSRYLEPGEISFVSLEADLEENIEVTYETNIEVKRDGYFTDKAVTVTDPAYVAPEGYEGAYMKAAVVNDTDAPLASINAVFVLEDAEGNLLALEDEALYRHELGTNSTLILWTSIDSRASEYFAANGIEPAAVEAYAWVESR